MLAEGLSQSKWSWYIRPRRLYDLQVYDNASRGPLGAFQLLWVLRCRPIIASLGAVITIAATLVDPLSQQLIKIYDCREAVLGDTVVLPRTQLFDTQQLQTGNGQDQITLSFLGSISAGQFSVRPPQVPFNCPTGNCTFEQQYSSVGYCSSCSDISNRIIFSDYDPQFPSVTVSADVGGEYPLSFTHVGDWISTRFMMNYNYFDTYDIGVNMLWFDAIFNGSRENDLRAHAYHCSMNPCIHTFQSNISNGLLLDETIQHGPIFERGVNPWNAYDSMPTVDLSCIDDVSRQDLQDIGYVLNSSMR